MINSDKVSYLFFNDQHKLLFFYKKNQIKTKKNHNLQVNITYYLAYLLHFSLNS